MGRIKKSDIEERQKFLTIYTEFNRWLESIGFRQGHYWNESSTNLDVNYWTDEKDKLYVDCLHGVEHYVNDTLELNIRILRDRNTHTIYEIAGAMQRTIGIPLEEYKQGLLTYCTGIKNEKLKKLEKLPF